jgi:hypothetical protein
MLGLALASSGALFFESPDQANVLVGVFRDSYLLPFHHVGDVGELGFPEAF